MIPHLAKSGIRLLWVIGWSQLHGYGNGQRCGVQPDDMAHGALAGDWLGKYSNGAYTGWSWNLVPLRNPGMTFFGHDMLKFSRLVGSLPGLSKMARVMKAQARRQFTRRFNRLLFPWKHYPRTPCSCIVYTLALTGSPYPNFEVYVYTIELHGAFGLPLDRL